MRKVNISQFKKCMIQELVRSYNLSKFEARTALLQSTVYNMLRQYPELVMHDSIEVNAKEVYDEYMIEKFTAGN